MQHWASLLQLIKATKSNSKIVKTNHRLKNVPHASLGPDSWQGNYDKNLKDLRKFECYAYKRIQESNIVISNLSFFLCYFSLCFFCVICVSIRFFRVSPVIFHLNVHEKPCPCHTFWIIFTLGLQMVRDDDDPLFK